MISPNYAVRSATVISLLFAMPIMAVAAPVQQSLPNVDAAPWNALLKEFVNANHRVAYARLKQNSSLLNDYIRSLGRPGTRPLYPTAKKALLINAYNAFTIQWVVQNYPIKSIWSTDAPFTKPRHRLGGRMVSLNEIESELRGMGDPRIHAALVCAARSCPPLRREAYVADRLNQQLDDNVREWLANASLNRFYPSQGKAEISPIFKWDGKDFTRYPGGLQGFLKKYAPPRVPAELGNRKLQISFLNYDWGLNDQSGAGQNYSRLQFGIDWVLNWFRSLTN